MIGLPPGIKVFLACQPIDLRAGFDGLAAKVQQIIGADRFSVHVFIFRGKRDHYLKGLYWDGSGMCLFAKRLECHKFVWPPIVKPAPAKAGGTLTLTPAQLALLIEAMDWRRTIAPPAPRPMLVWTNQRFLICSCWVGLRSIEVGYVAWLQPICPPILTHCGPLPWPARVNWPATTAELQAAKLAVQLRTLEIEKLKASGSPAPPGDRAQTGAQWRLHLSRLRR